MFRSVAHNDSKNPNHGRGLKLCRPNCKTKNLLVRQVLEEHLNYPYHP